MPDYIPSRDGDCVSWMNNLGVYITANGLSFGLTALRRVKGEE